MEDCHDDGLPEKGADDCEKRCFPKEEEPPPPKDEEPPQEKVVSDKGTCKDPTLYFDFKCYTTKDFDYPGSLCKMNW